MRRLIGVAIRIARFMILAISSPLPSEMRRLNAKFLAEPHSCRHRIRGTTIALHSINWRQPVLLTVVTDAIGVVGQVHFQIAAQIFRCDAPRASGLLAASWVQHRYPIVELVPARQR